MESKVQDLLKEIKKLKEENKKLKSRKKYGIVWEEEKEPEKIVVECKCKLPILKIDSQKTIFGHEDSPNNILIEGDNYHSLQVLNYTHKGRIDVIYIDPPYNTGNSHEWSYNDKYVDSNDSYKHSKWLNFMNKRLLLAKNILKSTGVIFIHIDKNEFAQLKLLCDEIFDEENYIENIIWRKKEGGGQQDDFFVTEHEYILVYAKNKSVFKFLDKKTKKNHNSYKYLDENKNKRYNLVKLAKWGSSALKEDRPTMHFPIKDPDGNDFFPKAPDGRDGRWRYGKSRVINLVKENNIEWGKKSDEWIPYEKDYQKEDDVQILKQRSIYYDYGSTGDGTRELTQIFGVKDTFSNPKPTSVVVENLLLSCPKNGVVLDFFAGSGTTGDAVLKVNSIDEGKRKFILCTNNELNGIGTKLSEENSEKDIDKYGVCQRACYPRIKKVMKGYKYKGDSVPGCSNSSLYYFKTDFINVDDVQNISDKKKIDLTYQTGELIAIKENTFKEVEKTNSWQIFKSSKKTVAIYFREDQEELEKLFEKLKKTKAVLYLFSWGKNELSGDDYNYPNIKIKDIPQPIIEVYKEINRL